MSSNVYLSDIYVFYKKLQVVASRLANPIITSRNSRLEIYFDLADIEINRNIFKSMIECIASKTFLANLKEVKLEGEGVLVVLKVL